MAHVNSYISITSYWDRVRKRDVEYVNRHLLKTVKCPGEGFWAVLSRRVGAERQPRLKGILPSGVGRSDPAFYNDVARNARVFDNTFNADGESGITTAPRRFPVSADAGSLGKNATGICSRYGRSKSRHKIFSGP
jgi:hypothetical protein